MFMLFLPYKSYDCDSAGGTGQFLGSEDRFFERFGPEIPFKALCEKMGTFCSLKTPSLPRMCFYGPDLRA